MPRWYFNFAVCVPICMSYIIIISLCPYTIFMYPLLDYRHMDIFMHSTIHVFETIYTNKVILGQNHYFLALTYVYLNILAVHLNAYITYICSNFYGL